MIGTQPRPWRRYVAVGDSFTEGMCDVDTSRDNAFVGWADRLALRLAKVAAHDASQFEYANLAIRGRKLDDIVTRQVPLALELEPDLVSLVGGGNDILRPRADIDALAEQLEEAVVRCREAGADVLMATPVDPSEAPIIQMTRGRAATFAAKIWSIAERHGAYVVNQWGMDELRDWRLWGADRIHMTPDGHERVSLRAYAALGLRPEDAELPQALPPLEAVPWRTRLANDASWTRTYFGPWVQRRLTGRSSGDGMSAKRPRAEVVDPTAALPVAD
ncbi:SGNH/GDSL hydrolase family protein [Mariniluteicoccus endophyticus]